MNRHLWHFGLGPLFETPPGGPGGAPPAGDPPAPPAAPAGGGGVPPAPPAPPADGPTVPYERFKAQGDELARYKAAEAERTEADAKKRGDYEALDKASKEKLAEANAKAERIARRAAFVSKAAGKVADAEAAYKLAVADGKLETLKIDDDGNVTDDKAVETIIAELLKSYEFLKVGSKNFGEPAGGNGAAGADPKPPEGRGSGRDMLRVGYEQLQHKG